MKPNILIFNPDQMRADTMGHLGNPAAITPNFDRFSQLDAVSFSNAYCQNPVCVPSRCSFFTGLYPHVRGHRTQKYLLHPDESSLFKELKDSGYFVWMNRRNDLVAANYAGNLQQHCDVFFQGSEVPPAPGTIKKHPRGELGSKDFYSFYEGALGLDEAGRNINSDEEAVEAAIAQIRNRPKDKPFCIFLGLFYPHPPYRIEEPYFSAIDEAKLPVRIKYPENSANHPRMLQLLHEYMGMGNWNEKDWNRIRTCYLAMCMKVDAMFGRLLDVLREEGLYDDTDVYVLSDHGDFTGDYDLPCKAQNLFMDCLVNVPLMVKPHRGVTVEPGICESMVELVDFYATALELVGIKSDHTHFGKSLLPVLANRAASHREAVFAEGGRIAGEKHCTEVSGDSVAVNNRFWPRMSAQLDDIAHTKATMIRTQQYKYVQRLYEQDEFYDLAADPQELDNVIDSPVYQDKIQMLRGMLLNWYQETGDIVPFKSDSSVTAEMIRERVVKQVPKEQLDDFMEAFDACGGNIGQMIQLFEQYGINALV